LWLDIIETKKKKSKEYLVRKQHHTHLPNPYHNHFSFVKFSEY
jgi:hypothetical protein